MYVCVYICVYIYITDIFMCTEFLISQDLRNLYIHMYIYIYIYIYMML